MNQAARSKSPAVIVSAVAFTFAVPAVGYAAFGVVPASLFLIGYFTGLIAWLVFPSRASYEKIREPYWIVFGLFVVHRIEEKVSGFFATLAAMTGVPTPEILSPSIVLLLILSVAAWVSGPAMIHRGYEFGYYLVWTFFCSMGITELGHFVFPLFLDQPYGYFPGMASVVVLAPAAWLCMWRLGNPKFARYPQLETTPFD